jgi:exodeoxyribonuclease VII small subunit
VSKKKEPTFAEARARLDEILDEVEGDSGDVDQLAAKVREASELIRLCRDRLSAARAEVSRVVADLAAVEQTVARGSAGDAPDEDGDEDDDEGSDDGGDEAADDAVGDRPAPGARRGGELPF